MERVDICWFSLWVVVGTWCLHHCSCVQYLYYTSTDGTIRRTRPPGLYGGPLPLNNNGSGDDLQQSGYQCTFFSDGEVYDNEKRLDIQHLAFDPVSKKALLRLRDTALTVLVGPLCKPLEECQPNVTNPSGLQVIFWKAAINYQIGAMTLYDNTLYYIVINQKRNGKQFEGSLELHKLNGCKDQEPVSASTDYDLSSCTHCITTLVTGVYRKFANFKPTDHILVIKTDTSLRFLTQTLTFHYNKAEGLEFLSMELLLIDEDGIVTLLHKEQVCTSVISSINVPETVYTCSPSFAQHPAVLVVPFSQAARQQCSLLRVCSFLWSVHTNFSARRGTAAE